jgi:hypothetical protein
MPESRFNRDEMARRYATRHLKTDTGIRSIYYLKQHAPEREIRLVEINELIADRDKDPLEPIDFGVDVGDEAAHSLLILDVTPSQWEKIRTNELRLPPGWSLDEAEHFPRRSA